MVSRFGKQKHPNLIFWLLTLSIAVWFGFLMNSRGFFSMGYQIGVADHNVLSPLGMQWADPNKFLGDWTIANAPQPHWLFDIITWLGAISGQIELVYFVYWFLELMVFGIATTLIVSKYFPQNRISVSLGYTFVLAQTPWLVMGTGTLQIPYPLPGLLGAELAYLMVALLLVSKYKGASFVVVLTTLVHVQVGSLVIVIALLYSLGFYFQRKKILWPLLISAFLSIIILILNLLFRPVASNLSDFVEACETLIPYHCSAHQWGDLWGPLMIPSCIGFLALVGFSYRLFVQGKHTIYVWFCVIGIPLIGLTLGFIFDLFQVPLLGVLSQGVNVYRIGVLLFPFGVWGIFAFLRKPINGFKESLLFILWASSVVLFMQQPGAWPTGGWVWNLVLSAALIILVFYHSTVLSRTNSTSGTQYLLNLVIVSMISFFMVALIANNGFVVRPINLSWVPDQDRRNWGQQISDIVPPGEVLTGSPFWTDLRLITERAIVIDCKYAPYGGQAWLEWESRTNMLGGCKDPEAYERIPAIDLIEIAEKYKSKYILQMNERFTQIEREMNQLGWNVLREPNISLGLPGIFVKSN